MTKSSSSLDHRQRVLEVIRVTNDGKVKRWVRDPKTGKMKEVRRPRKKS
jgi:hypothetical protein